MIKSRFTNPLPYEIKDPKELVDLLSSDISLVVFFYATYCGYCVRTHPIFRDIAIDFHRSNVKNPILFAIMDGPKFRDEISSLLPDAIVTYPAIFFKSNPIQDTKKWKKDLHKFPTTERTRDNLIKWIKEETGDPYLEVKEDRCKDYMKSNSASFIFIGKSNRKIMEKFILETEKKVMIDIELSNDLYRYYFSNHKDVAEKGLYKEAEGNDVYPSFIDLDTKKCYKYRDADLFFKERILEMKGKIQGTDYPLNCDSSQKNISLNDKNLYHYDATPKSISLLKSVLLSKSLSTLSNSICSLLSKEKEMKGNYLSINELLEERGGSGILFHEIKKEDDGLIKKVYLISDNFSPSDISTKSIRDVRIFDGVEYKQIPSHYGIYEQRGYKDSELFVERNGKMVSICKVNETFLMEDVVFLKRMLCDGCNIDEFITKK